MERIGVREATSEDARTIARIRAQTWQAAYSHVFLREALAGMSEESAMQRAAAWWTDAIRNAAAYTRTLVAERGGEALGFAHFGLARDEPEDVGELFLIYVLPDESGRGVGQALMVEALERLRADGFREAVLWVLEDNPRTRRFYELAGWHFDGGVTDDELLGVQVREVRYRIPLVPAS